MYRVLAMSERIYEEDIGTVLLDGSKFRLRSASDGETALRMLAVWPADLLVVGDHLEDLRINHFLRRAAETAPTMRILVLCENYGAELDRSLGNACLADPIDERTFADAVADLLEIAEPSHGRIEFQTIAKLVRAHAAAAEAAYLVQLSPRGCQVETALPYELSEEVSLCFFLPDLSTPVTTEAIVRARVDDDGLVLGLEFLSFTDDTMESLLVAFCELNRRTNRGAS